MGNGMRGMQGKWENDLTIRENLLEDSGKCYHFNIPENVGEDFAECLKIFKECPRNFWGIFGKILANVQNDPGEYYQRFWDIEIWIYFVKSCLFFSKFTIKIITK